MIRNEQSVPIRNNRIAGDANAEKRAGRRQRVLKGARLIFNGGQSVADAVIRDISETGVRLRLGETLGIPRELEMAVAGETERRPVQVVWRTHSELGVALR